MSYLIITVDGGGIRGVLPALLLRALGQARINRASYFAGTSTGGLLVTGLAGGVPIDKIAATYLDPANCHTIFTPYVDGARRPAAPHRSLLQRLEALVENEEQRLLHSGIADVIEELLDPMYTSDGLRGIVNSFHELPATIGAIGPRLLLPTFRLDAKAPGGPQWRATAFHNLPEGTGIDGHAEAPPVEAILATTAAPMYFPPHPYAGHLHVDGGVMAQNPTMYALAAATRAGLIGPHGVPYDQVTVLSIGTGRNESSYPPAGVSFPPPYGILGWEWPKPRGDRTPAFPLTDAIFDGVAELTHYQVEALVGADSYRRVQLDLGTKAVAMNDCGCIKRPGGLEELAAAHIASQQWRDVVAWLDQRLK